MRGWPARRARDTTIISSDKDLMQLVGPTVSMYDPMKDRQIGVAEVIEKWGVPPEKMIDLQAMTGDSVDNVPGVPGIGPKTAAQLLEQFGDLDTLLARAGEIKQDKRRQTIIDNADKARISRELVRLKNDVPLTEGLDDLVLQQPDGPKLIAFLKTMEFTTLTRRVAEATGTDAAEIAPAVGGRRYDRHARAGRRRRRAAPGNACRRRRSCAGQRRRSPTARSIRRQALAGARAQAVDGRQDRPQALRLHPPSRRARGMDRRGARDRHRRLPHRDHLARSRCGPSRSASRWPSSPERPAYIPVGHRSSAVICWAAGASTTRCRSTRHWRR